MHVYCPPPQIKVSCPDLSRGRDKGSQNWCWWPNKFGEVAWHDGSGAIIKNKDNIRARLKIRVGKHTRQHSWRRAILTSEVEHSTLKGNDLNVRQNSVFLQNEHINTTCLFERWQCENTFKDILNWLFCKITRIRDGECFNMATLNPHLFKTYCVCSGFQLNQLKTSRFWSQGRLKRDHVTFKTTTQFHLWRDKIGTGRLAFSMNAAGRDMFWNSSSRHPQAPATSFHPFYSGRFSFFPVLSSVPSNDM